MLNWKIGDVRISCIVETIWPVSPRFLFPDVDRERLAQMDWLKPHFVDDQNRMLLSIHALLIESQGQCIMVDTCLGNDKPRDIEDWHMRSGPFLTQLEDAGFPPERIDTVLCTHLHVDHVGWNTRLVDGIWVPTFANAKYLFAREEWAYHQAQADVPVEIIDSVRPVMDAGLAVLVERNHRVTDEIWLEPTPGHTAGHVSVHISSAGEEAVITGDMTHHPCQLHHPHWSTRVDFDPAQARTTREAFYDRYADRPVLIIGTHFAAPTAGHIVRDGQAFRLVI